MNIVERASKDGTKVFYTPEWGRKPGKRISTGIYTYIYPKNKIQRDYNIQSLSNLETLKAQTLLDLQTRGTNFVSPAKLKENFLRFSEKYLEKNRSENNRSLPCCLAAFKKFVAIEQGKPVTETDTLFICALDITPSFCERFRKYLLDTQIATARGNLISTILAMQSDHQLRLHYGKEWADVVLNICGNIMIGQTSGELAKSVSERLGKTLQDRESISVNSADTSISRSRQLEVAVPVSTISTLSSGEFVGMVADTPAQPIEQKIFHAKVKADDNALKKETKSYLPPPTATPLPQKKPKEKLN